MPFSERLTVAVDLARRAHNLQTRKGSSVPYLSHLFAVASLVMEAGGNEDQVCAAFLHDVLEDAGPAWADAIRDELGEHVFSLVLTCTDGLPDGTGKKEAWHTRKLRYIAHLSEESALADEALLISAADKLHNLRSLLLELETNGPETWLRFVKEESTLKGKAQATLWYYESLLTVFERRAIPIVQQLAPLVEFLRRKVEELA